MPSNDGPTLKISQVKRKSDC